MATKELNSRIMQKASTEEEWEAVASTFIPLRGEVCVYFMTDGSTKIKIGDGTTTVGDLLFVGGDTVDLSVFVTADDPSSAIEGTIPETFDGHTVDEFLLKTDVVNNLTSEATNVPLSANQGKVLNQAVQQNATNIGNIETEVESINTTVSGLSSSLSGKLNLSGGTMTGALIAQSNTNYTVGQVRNIYLSTEAPTNDVGSNGDIWIVYGG